jgi:hypothetical protein
MHSGRRLGTSWKDRQASQCEGSGGLVCHWLATFSLMFNNGKLWKYVLVMEREDAW